MLQRGLRGRLLCKLFFFILNSVIIALIWSYFFKDMNFSRITPLTASPNLSSGRTNRHISKILTVVFRQFEENDNDIADSVQSFVSAFPNMHVLIVCENNPYPPFPFSLSNDTLRNVRIVQLQFKLKASPVELNPLSYIKTEFTLFVPDSTHVSRRLLQQAIPKIFSDNNQAVAIGVTGSRLLCQKIQWSPVDWSLIYHSQKTKGAMCDAVYGKHALLIRTATLKILPDPFVFPFPEALYLQTSVRQVKVHVQEGRLNAGRNVLRTYAVRQKALQLQRDRRTVLYNRLGVKRVVREDGHVQWFGCTRDTERCFPPVQGTPSYILAGRYTPPCCRKHMRRLGKHVLHTLLAAGVRCWLETTALLGAVTRRDLLPWAEHVDLGIHADDVYRMPLLSRGGSDEDGYIWEHSTRGRYYRVAYSKSNRVYVLVLPFRVKNGTMWPADWVLKHQREFPERHLHPLAQVPFAGYQAPAPNDAKTFLDIKLGAGAVEKSQKIGVKLLYPSTDGATLELISH